MLRLVAGVVASAACTVEFAVTLTAPANGSTTINDKPPFSGAAGNAAGDGTTVTVKKWNR